MTTTDPIERAAQALRAETLGRHGRTESISTPQDYVPLARAAFASIDRNGLARALYEHEYPHGPSWETREAWQAAAYIARAEAVLAWLTKGTW